LEKRMLKMDKVYVTRHKVLVEGLSQREVARQLNVDKETVAKYVKESSPKRKERKAREKPVTIKVAGRIDELLIEWRGRTTGKQRITCARIHRQLLEEGYVVGRTTVKDYLREKRRESKEVYIPLIYGVAEVAQVDYFEVVVQQLGQQKKVWKFLMRLQYSGYEYVWLYEKCDQTSFLDAHVRAFKAMEGVAQRIVYDK
jgi:transposase